MEKTNAMRLLERAGVPYTPLEYPCPKEPLDAVRVANLLGAESGRVFKTLVLLSSDGQVCVCVIPGPNELDLKKAAAAFRVRSLRMLHADEITPHTGYVRGGCSPVGMKKRYRTALDENALEWDEIVVSGGRLGLQMKIKPGDLAKTCGAVWARLTM